jgi:hypothetical protein
MYGRKHEQGICFYRLPDEPLNFQYFLTVRGQDCFHIYLWIMKDLCWVQSWYWPALIFGSATLFWSFMMLLRAVARKSLDEVWTHSAQFLWLFGNFMWMQGELHDYHYPQAKSIYTQRADEGGYMFIAALVWISLYYGIAKPLNITSSNEVNAAYNSTGFEPRFSFFFKTWREYENVHILFWVGKDTFWCWYIDYMWVLFAIPTILIALDFVWISFNAKYGAIDFCHYLSQLVWVAANATWCVGEFWFSVGHDQAWPMTHWNREIRITARWYSSWVLVGSCIPLVILFVVWIPATWLGMTHEDEEDIENDVSSLNPTSSSCSSSGRRTRHEVDTIGIIDRLRQWSSSSTGVEFNSNVVGMDDKEDKDRFRADSAPPLSLNSIDEEGSISPIIIVQEEDPY